MRFPQVVALACLAACSDKKREEPRPPEPQVGMIVRGDAGIAAVVIGVDPMGDPSGMHMDDPVAARPVPAQPALVREGKPIDITLRSTPPGAQVAVDGSVLGTTPAFWPGKADGREHEFVFTMHGYAIARYRFVPVASGVIHGRLDRIHEETDAGVPAAPPEVVPPKAPTPSTINPPSAPPTIVPPASDADVTAPVAPSPAPAPAEPAHGPVGPQP
jgi:hypothetical protein